MVVVDIAYDRRAPKSVWVEFDLVINILLTQTAGILGRTGGGKSTLALSFFRFVEATEGQIVIDGLDISKVGLTDLRSRLTVIPREPVNSSR